MPTVRNIARMYDGTARLHDEEGVEIVQLNKLGVFAESVVVPEQACFPIPDVVPWEVAALMGCCVTTGFGGIVNQPDIRPGAQRGRLRLRRGGPQYRAGRAHD